MSYALGVDLGTTFTAAATANGAGPTMIGLGNRALQVPSVLFLDADHFLVGESAERRGAVEPDRLVREFKRRLGDHVPLLVGGAPFSAELLTARLLSWVIATTSERMGEPPVSVILTHPANWGPFKMEVFRQVSTLADVPNVTWIPEPVAAAAQYASRARVEIGEKLAIYDLGGGTFDVCVVEKTDDGFRMLGNPDGVEHLGGTDLDHALFERVMASLSDRLHDLDPDDPELAIGLSRLRRDCVDAKEALSSDVTAVVPVALPGLSTSVRVTRSEFEELIRPSLMETLAATRRGLSSADIQSSELTAVVLIGGSSRIPLVGEMLQHEFGIPAALDTHPKHDVALGAARLGSSTGPAQPTPTATPSPTPATRPAVTTSSTPAVPALPAPPAPPAGRGPLGPAPSDPVSPDPVPPGSAPPSSPEAPVSEPSARPRWQLIAVIGIVLVALVATVVVIQVLGSRRNNVATPGPAPTDTGPTESASSPSPSVTATAPKLPRSRELTASELVIPMQVNGNWNLYLADTKEPGPVRALRSTAAAELNPVLSPDFATIAYVHDADTNDGVRTLHVAGAADGSGDRPLFDPVPPECSGTMNRPAWNPADPTVVAVSCTDSDGTWGLYIIRTDGTVLREVTHGEQRVDDPAFSPDGKRLAFWAGPQSAFSGGEIYVANADGSGKAKKLTTAVISGQDADPTWSPDGQSIAFRRRTVTPSSGGNLDIYSVLANGSKKPTPLAATSADEQDPAWSRYGDRIAYKSNGATKDWPGKPESRIWVMDENGHNQHVLWTEGEVGPQGAPAWSPR